MINIGSLLVPLIFYFIFKKTTYSFVHKYWKKNNPIAQLVFILKKTIIYVFINSKKNHLTFVQLYICLKFKTNNLFNNYNTRIFDGSLMRVVAM